MSLLKKILDSYLTIVILSLVIGVLFSEYTVFLASYSTIILGAIFFLSALKIDFKAVMLQLKKPYALIMVTVIMLFILPAVVYFLALWLYPSLAIPFLLLAAMPAGMTAPLLAEISGGKKSLALILTVITSLLAPFTVPLVIKILASASVDVDAVGMMITLAQVIFIPFILANIIKHYWGEERIDRIEGIFKSISVFLLALLIIGIVAKQANVITASLLFGGPAITSLFLLFVFFALLHILGYFAVPWRHAKDRISITICITYMNFTLAIVLADKYFHDESTVLTVILSVIPWALMLSPFRFILRKLGYTTA